MMPACEIQARKSQFGCPQVGREGLGEERADLRFKEAWWKCQHGRLGWNGEERGGGGTNLGLVLLADALLGDGAGRAHVLRSDVQMGAVERSLVEEKGSLGGRLLLKDDDGRLGVIRSRGEGDGRDPADRG